MVTDSLFIFGPSFRSGLTKQPLNRTCLNSMSLLRPTVQIAVSNNILALYLLIGVLVEPYPPRLRLNEQWTRR